LARKRKLDIAKYKRILEQQRAELQEQLKRLEEQTTGRGRFDASIATEDFDEPGGDAAAETLERSLAMATSENLREMLDLVNGALAKIEKGTYGVCDACGKDIPKKRLDALPYATMCLSCRARLGPR